MNEFYEPLKQDYFRAITLGVMYTCVSQLFKLTIYEINDKLYYTRFFNHLYWYITLATKNGVILVLSYPQIDEMNFPTRSSWNVTVLEVSLLGITISFTEYILNFIMQHLQKSVLYNFYNRKEFNEYLKVVSNNQLRRSSSISLIYKIKNELKQKEIYKKYYISDEETFLAPSMNSLHSSEPRLQNSNDLEESQTLILDTDTESRIIPTSSIGLGGGLGAHLDLPNGDSFHGGFGGGFDYGRKKSRSSSKKSKLGLEVIIDDELVAGQEDEETDEANQLMKKKKFLILIGILNIPEFILNLEIPIVTKKNFELSNKYYKILMNSSILSYWINFIWKLDNAFCNLFECLTMALYFLDKIKIKYVTILIVILCVLRSFKYEIWRYYLLSVIFTNDTESHQEYGTFETGIVEDDTMYMKRCRIMTYFCMIFDTIALCGVLSFLYFI